MTKKQKLIDIEMLLKKYKELKSKEENGIYFIEGFLSFSKKYNNVSIKDSYFIQIKIPYKYPKILPLTKEIGGRILRTPDNHINYDNSLCLGTELEATIKLSKEYNLIKYIDELVIPFLYAFSHKEKFGTMPFGERPHGYKGILDFYKEFFKTDSPIKAMKLLAILANNVYKGFYKCPCGSNKLLKNCHGKDLNKLKKFKSKHSFKKDYENCYITLSKDIQGY